MRDTYKREYVGRIRITRLEPGYRVELYMATQCPVVFCAEVDDGEFVRLLKEDLKARRFDLVGFGRLGHVYPAHGCPSSSSCNDKG